MRKRKSQCPVQSGKALVGGISAESESESGAKGGKEPREEPGRRESSRHPEAEADLAGPGAARRGWTGVRGPLMGDGVTVMRSGHRGPLGL